MKPLQNSLFTRAQRWKYILYIVFVRVLALSYCLHYDLNTICNWLSLQFHKPAYIALKFHTLKPLVLPAFLNKGGVQQGVGCFDTHAYHPYVAHVAVKGGIIHSTESHYNELLLVEYCQGVCLQKLSCSWTQYNALIGGQELFSANKHRPCWFICHVNLANLLNRIFNEPMTFSELSENASSYSFTECKKSKSDCKIHFAYRKAFL